MKKIIIIVLGLSITSGYFVYASSQRRPKSAPMQRLEFLENKTEDLSERVSILEHDVQTLKQRDFPTSSIQDKQDKIVKSSSENSNGEKLEEVIKGMLKDGAIHSINVEYNEARIDPVLWAGLGLEQKQQLVMMLSVYFESKDSTGRVTILSNRNDKKLATYGVWGGLKILE